ncbi:MAG: Gfo/Idh/MocA family oxidoreductase [Oscillospiraceae bacterium]|nr:Gfo/Idh/MocA family oxidoreductase [Oscillospiraceae bacterium]
MAKIRIAFVGTGGRSWTHIERLGNFGDVELVGFMDVIPERAIEKQAKTGQGKAYESYIEMLDDAKPDVLYVCVSPDGHGAIEREAIARGIHLFVEKPMALDMAMAEEICASAKAKNLVTCIGFQDRYLDLVEQARDWMAGHKVGLVDGAWVGGLPGPPWYPKYATCGGQLLEQNIHIFDMLRFLFGEPASVYCSGGRGIIAMEGYDLHDYSSAVITMESGVVATLFSGCYLGEGSPGYVCGMNIHCADRTIRYKLRDKVTLETRTENITYWKRAADWQTTMNRVFIDAVKTGDTSAILSPYEDALKTLRLCLACNESMETGQVVKL